MLESKNKLLDNIIKSVKPEAREQHNVDQAKITQINNDFMFVEQHSHQQEQVLLKYSCALAVRCVNIYHYFLLFMI